MQDNSSSNALATESNASAALLMLDIASAKSSLAQLQEACATATEEHTRTKSALLSQQHLDFQGPKYALEGLKTPLGSRTVAQQLQALHSENLHLKACLKEEVQARQRLEKKHGELLDLLRSGRVLELLASSFVASTAALPVPHNSEQQHWPSSTEVFRRITADDVHGPDQLTASRAAAASSDATSSGTQQQPGRTTSSSSYTSSTADGSSPHAWQQKASIPQSAPGSLAGAQPLPHHASSGVPAHSAYFPVHARQQQPSSRADGCIDQDLSSAHYSRHAPGGVGSAAAAARPAPPAATFSSPSAPAAPGTWQESLQQGLFAKMAQQGSSSSHGHGSTPSAAALHQQLQQCSTPPGSTQRQHTGFGAGHGAPQHQQQQQQLQDRMQDLLMRTAEGGQRPHASPGMDFSTGFEVAEGLLSTTSSSQSAQSELLDSDDLDELAGLCDTLLQQHAAQPAHHTPSTAAGSGTVRTLQQQQSRQHMQQGLAGTAWFGAAGPGEDACGYQQQGQHTPTGATADAADQACAPGLQALAAQLQLLQEQVTATAMDAAPLRPSSSAAGTTPATQGPPGTWGSDNGMLQQNGRHASAAGAAFQQEQHPGSRAEQRRRSTGSTGAGPGPQQHTQPGFCEGPPLASLQQQLAQRMQEVKERLSNICNGMLQDGQVPAGSGMPSGTTHSSNSFCSPPASPPAEHSGSASARGQQPKAGLGPHQQGPPSTSKPFAGSSDRAASGATAGKLAGSAQRSMHQAPARQPFFAHSKAAAGSMRDGSGHKPFSPAAPAATSTRATAAPASPSVRRAGQAGPAGHAAGPDVAAAAFESIKAAVDSASTTSAPGGSAMHARRLHALGLMPEVPGKKPSHGRLHAHHTPAEAAMGNAAAAAAVAAAQGSMGQQSWSSTDEAPASDDSEGSWATVDDATEQEQLHAAQQATTQQHSERATNSTATNPASSSVDDKFSGSTSPAPAKGSSPVSQGQQGVGGDRTPAAGTPLKKAFLDAERAASPISCESSMLGVNLAARMPAEVVFSPVKIRP